MTDKLMAIMTGCDRRMLRYMAGIDWRDQVRSGEVADGCGVEPLEVVLGRRRFRWFEHVKRSDGSEPLGKIMSLNVTGRRPPGRPKKSCRMAFGENSYKSWMQVKMMFLTGICGGVS